MDPKDRKRSEEAESWNDTIEQNLKKLASSTLTFQNGAKSLSVGLKTYTAGVAKVDSGAKSLKSGTKTLKMESQPCRQEQLSYPMALNP